ncbi:hypothetical protein [Actinomadura rupiterrae]|uniref:hypothetical protein n=1 Tax=Actinomadura rupiterrae TaxID=559627 RepID=UPI0020A2E6EF|nr:hypothetical protein [Actinomadura rupiterrae]MCP2340155.1 hypothetical protein [Actinomadura rupiterrae]
MTPMTTVQFEAPGGATVESRRPVPQETEMNLLSQDLSRERIPVRSDVAPAAADPQADAPSLAALGVDKVSASEPTATSAAAVRADVAEMRAARVRALRRARREARFRAARVNRALLAPAPRRPLD